MFRTKSEKITCSRRRSLVLLRLPVLCVLGCDATTEFSSSIHQKRRPHGILQQDTRETRLRQLGQPCASDEHSLSGEPGCGSNPSRAQVGRGCRCGRTTRATCGGNPQKLNWRTSIVDLLKLLD